MKIFIVAFNDCFKYGNGTKSVKAFTDKDEAYNYLENEYQAKCKEEPCTDCHFGGSYAYISDMYYWDIFEIEIDVAQ